MTFHIHYDGRHVVCMTTSGLDHIRVPSAVFGKPRDAIRYCDMREARISPVRGPEEEPTDLPQSTGSSSGPLTRLDVDTPAASS